MHDNIVEISDGNIGYSNGVTAYFYEIIPFNSIYSEKAQIDALLEIFETKLTRVNMAGQLMVLPQQIDSKEIVKNYGRAYNKYGFPELEFMAKEVIDSLVDVLKVAIRYKYKIFLVFTQDRGELDNSWLKKFSSSKIFSPDKATIKIAQSIESDIYRELVNGLNARRLSDVELAKLISYLAIPLERETESWYYTQEAEHLDYTYYPRVEDKELETRKLYTRQLIATELPPALDGYTEIFNQLQFRSYPIDIILKFDILQSKKFSDKMESQKNVIQKDRKRQKENIGYVKQDTQFNYEIAKKVVEGQIYDADAKLDFQIMLRIRAESLEMLDARYINLRQNLGFEVRKKNGYMFSYEVGRQEKLYDNLNPFDATYYNYIQRASVRHVAKYNWFGGLYLGDEDGLLLALTRPGFLPVLLNPEKMFARENLSSAPAFALVGQTGAGKTQFANVITLAMLVIFGMPIFDVDPKGGEDGQIKLYNRFPKGLASHLIIGADDNQKGMFDPFNNSVMNEEDKINEASRLLMMIARVYNPNIEINAYNFRRAYDDAKEDTSIKRVTCMEIAKHLEVYDKLNADNLKMASMNKFGQLFFAESDDKPYSFDLDKVYNLITFVSTPSLEKNPDDVDLGIFQILTSQISVLVDEFKARFLERNKIVKIDEVSVFNATTAGHLIIDKLVRTARSAITFPFIMDQKYKTLEPYLSQCGYQLIGNIDDNTEIDNIIRSLHLEKNDSIVKVLTDKTQVKGEVDDQKYRFLYRDADMQTGIVRAEMMKAFSDVLHPLKDRDKYEN